MEGNVPGPTRPRDLVKIAHINRHSPELELAVGFARGWGLKARGPWPAP